MVLPMAFVYRRNFLLLVAKLPTAELQQELERRYGSDLLAVGMGAWLILTSENEQDFADHMGIIRGAYGPCVVVSSGGMAGFISEAAAKWIEERQHAGV